MRLRKLSLALLAFVGLASGIPAGRAQENPFDPSAFADTTLLRDTLGLTFPRLFWLADSLRLRPDTLRAISVRYLLTLPRLVALADSMRVRVDSVGPVLQRERFNPLAVRPEMVTDFSYTTTYNLQRTSSSWNNGSEVNMSRGPLFLSSVTTIEMDNFESGGRTTQQQRRNSNTEVGWRLNPDYSLGGRVVLGRFNSDDPSTVTQVGETRDEFQLSARARQRPFHGASSEMNFFSGVMDLRNASQEKRGLTTDFNGRLRHTAGAWFLHEVRGRASGSFVRTRAVRSGRLENTRDLLGNLNGTLSLFEGRPVAFNGAYTLDRTRVRVPDDTGEISPLNSSLASADASIRGSFPNGGYVTVSDRVSSSDRFTAVSGPSRRLANSFSADGRYVLMGFGLETRFTLEDARAELPQVSDSGGYGEDFRQRALEGSVTRRITPALLARANARISLVSYRYDIFGNYGTPPTARDQAQQSYRLDTNYNVSEDFTSGVSLEVSRNRLVNLPSRSTRDNNNVRSYRAEWRWTYRLFRGLTATQRNTLNAYYTAYQFLQNADRLLLDYGTTTTLNAVLNTRLNLALTHIGQSAPSGSYRQEADGLWYFLPADETKGFTLTSRLQYSPFPGVSLNIEPSYRSQERESSPLGVTQPQRRERTLNFTGTASLNLPVGRKGLLSGTFGKTYNGNRTTAFVSGVPQVPNRSELDFWNSSLQFSWRL